MRHSLGIDTKKFFYLGLVLLVLFEIADVPPLEASTARPQDCRHNPNFAELSCVASLA